VTLSDLAKYLMRQLSYL